MELRFLKKEDMDGDFIKNLHTSTFGEELPSDYFRFDLALLSEKDGVLYSYALIRELASDSIEMAWGGTAIELQGYSSKKSFSLFVDKCLEHYPIVTFQCLNTNTRMIRLGLLEGFIITGCRQSAHGGLFLIFTKLREE